LFWESRDSDVRKLTMPVMLIYGDSDMIRLEHAVKFYQLLGGGLKDAGWQRENMSQNRLAIIPSLTHYEMGLAPQLVDTALPFLSGEGRPVTWDEQVIGKVISTNHLKCIPTGSAGDHW
jgi:pimeloyl-ACP methyl ester carboxylesterase